MKSAKWKDVAELIGTAAIVATLVFVGFQMRQAQAIAKGEMNAAVLANAIEGSNAIIANADIWVRGNAGEKLTPVEEAIFAQLVTGIDKLTASDEAKRAPQPQAATASFQCLKARAR